MNYLYGSGWLTGKRHVKEYGENEKQELLASERLLFSLALEAVDLDDFKRGRCDAILSAFGS